MSWPAPLPCGCPNAGLVAVDEQRHAAYHAEIGGPASCLTRCLCGTCPQYADQATATELLRQQEYAARTRTDGQRQARRRKAAA